MTDTPYPLLAAVCAQKGSDVDALLASVTISLRKDAARVAGFLRCPSVVDDCNTIELENIASGRRFVISQNLGPGAKGCRLDPQRLAALVMPTIENLAGVADFLVLNRFGKAEAEGGGWRRVIEEAVTRSIPVLTAAREDHAPAWDEFTGELGIVLPPQERAALRWARGAITASGGAGHAA